MKRDMDMVRSILLAVEANPTDEPMREIDVPECSQDELVYHLSLVYDAGFINALTSGGLKGGHIAPLSLTWSGHEYLEVIRDNAIWSKTKKTIKEKGGALSFELIKSVAMQYAKSKLGLSPES